MARLQVLKDFHPVKTEEGSDKLLDEHQQKYMNAVTEMMSRRLGPPV